jgi:GMP synthase (glutamine-hydrolysing)
MVNRNEQPVILVVQPDPIGDLGRFDNWLAEAGAVIQIVRPYAGDVIPVEVDADGLIVLGGRMSADDDLLHPWLKDIRNLLMTAVNSETPTLGICLGGQLLALALGGDVSRGDAGLEAGVVAVDWLDGAASDPLVHDLPGPLLVGTMHSDGIVTLPPQAQALGHGAVYPHQAFRVGTAWGVQFHPEVSASTYSLWVDADSDHGKQDDSPLARSVAEFERLDGVVAAANAQIAQQFVALARVAGGKGR